MFQSYAQKNGGIDFDASHRVIGAFIDALQNNFREDTNYKRPMMPPQVNVIFALDDEAADSMIAYMSTKIKDVGGFKDNDFRFTRRSNPEGGGLHRVRLEFTAGVTVEVIRKVIAATDKLAKH